MTKRNIVYYSSKIHDFLEGCCVPTSSLLWMIIVFFIFITLVSLCGCIAIIFTRLYYKWKARRRLEVEQKRRRDDDEIRRLEAFRKKQLEIQLLTRVPSKDYEAPHTQYVALPTGVTPPSQYYWDRFNTARLPDADSDKRTGDKNGEKKMSTLKTGHVARNSAKAREDRKETVVDLSEASKHPTTVENLKGALNELEEKTAVLPSESVTARSTSHRSRRRKSHHKTPHKRSNKEKHSNRTKEKRVKRRQFVSEDSKPSSASSSARSSRRKKSIKQRSNSSSSEQLQIHRRKRHHRKQEGSKSGSGKHHHVRKRCSLTSSSHHRNHRKKLNSKKPKHDTPSPSSASVKTNMAFSGSTASEYSSHRQYRSKYEIDALKTAAFIEHMARGKQKIRKTQPNANLLLVASKEPSSQLPQIKPSVPLSANTMTPVLQSLSTSTSNKSSRRQSSPAVDTKCETHSSPSARHKTSKRSPERATAIAQSALPRNNVPTIAPRRLQSAQFETDRTQKETPPGAFARKSSNTTFQSMETKPASFGRTPMDNSAIVTATMLNMPPTSPFLGDSLYWTSSSSKRMQIEPNRSPNSGELREVVVHSQERSLWIPPDTRALARMQRDKEAEKSDAPEKLPVSATLKPRRSPSPTHVLVHSPRFSSLANAQSYRVQPTAVESQQRPSPRQLYPSPPPQFYHPLRQAPSSQVVKQGTTVSRGISSREKRIISNEGTVASTATKGFLPRAPPPAPLMPIHRPSPQAALQDPNRRALIELSSSNTSSLRNAQRIRIPRG